MSDLLNLMNKRTQQKYLHYDVLIKRNMKNVLIYIMEKTKSYININNGKN